MNMFLLSTAEAPGFLQVVAMGLITVFVVLICLIILIKIMGAILGGSSSADTAAAAQPQRPVPAPAAPAAAAPNKQQLVAAISAAIAEDMGSDVNHIKIHSIKRL